MDVHSFQTDGSMFRKEKSILPAETAPVLCMQLHVYSFTVVIAFAFLKTHCKRIPNNFFKKGTDRNAAIAPEYFPKTVQLHDLFSALLQSLVKFLDVLTQTIIHSSGSLLSNTSVSAQAVVNFIISRPPQTNTLKYVIHRVYRTSHLRIPKELIFLTFSASSNTYSKQK